MAPGRGVPVIAGAEIGVCAIWPSRLRLKLLWGEARGPSTSDCHMMESFSLRPMAAAIAVSMGSTLYKDVQCYGPREPSPMCEEAQRPPARG